MEVKNLLSLKGKNICVVGGAGYIGSSITDALAEFGANVMICSRDLKKCSEKAQEVTKNYGTYSKAFEVDITDTSSIKRLKQEFISEELNINSLVICAWNGKKNSLDSISVEDWNYDINVCLNGVFYLIKEFLEDLKQSKGNILSIASMYGYVAPDYKLYQDVPQVNPPSYGAAKAGVIQMTKYLASFLSEHQVRANCISPGPLPFPATMREYPEFVSRLEQKNPCGRIGEPDDIKTTALLLCSDAGSYINGQNICIDGGWGIW